MASRGKRKREAYIHQGGEETSAAGTASNRRVRKEVNYAPPSPTKKATFDGFDAAMGYDPDDASFEQPVREGPAAIKIKAKRYDSSDHQVKFWITHRETYAECMVRREGRGPWWAAGCGVCEEANPTWRCEDCFGGRMVCASCIVERHRDEPLHFLEEWEDGFFRPRTVSKDLKMRYQLGHKAGEDCQLGNALDAFVVMHDNGIHEVDVEFCGCSNAPSEVQQLINIGWFPATPENPETAASFSVLRRFHTLNLSARVPAYDFYNALVLLRTEAGLKKPPYRLPQFMHITREYRHLQMGKRAGRVHDVTGFAGTKPGECSIDCRPCPHPGINLPEDWADAPPEVAWIYRLLLSKDANFKLKGRDRSSREKDPTLGPGWAYMVASDDYLKHLVQFVEEDEISHCVSFAALWSANNKRSKGLRASGVGSVSCSRHEMFRARGTGDLQKGERYSNMDYLFFSSLIGMTLLCVVSSYDIACQWGRNFWTRATNMPTHMRLPAGVKVLFKVPKFHLPPHIKKCHGPYAFNYTKGVGRTDGEGVERNWSWLNGAARFISVMGPGSREDTIDDLCGFSNWKKTCDLGNSLLRKMVLAIPQAMIHSRAFHAFTDGLREGHEDELQDWERTVRAWEAHPKPEELVNPYDYPDIEAESMADVVQRISQEDHARVAMSGAAAMAVKPAGFLMAGMEIEESQAELLLEAKRTTRTTIQATTLQRQRTLLLSKISALQDVQETYMPGLRQWITQKGLPAPNKSKPETIPLYMPSTLPAADRAQLCIPGLIAHEESLRSAQAGEGLRALRSGLRTRVFAHQFKRRLNNTQGVYTKSRTLTDGIEDRIRAAAAQYRTARVALLALRGHGEWEEKFQELRKEDIRGMNERLMNDTEKEDNRRARLLAGLSADGKDDETDEYGEPVDLTVLFNLEVGEGTRVLSWIWYSATTRGDATEEGKLHEDIRVEWLKARARADRWREELILVEEEMRRVIAFCHYRARWWAARLDSRPDADPELAEGLRAYALEQVHRELKWAEKWAAKWAAVRARAGLVVRDHLVDVREEVLIPLEVDLDDEEEGEEFANDVDFEEDDNAM
ncbi:hypothetical protein DFH06DRAFT_1341651 [Mycena polygramma]|nr:hypothetical protein DFH06DRAFT_1341651 [Mycena polygramma]